jgi:dTMP kinase
MFRGKFIAFYGVNGIGKTTHAKKFARHLKKDGYDPVYIKYPIYGLEPTGPYLNKILRGSKKQAVSEEELQLWFVLNRHQYMPKLKKMLEKGQTVVAEDYIGTGIAWGMTKGASEDWLQEINKYLLRPDLSLLIDGEPDKNSKEKVHIHETRDTLVKKARESHLRLAEKYAWFKVQLQEKQDDTAALIWETVTEYFNY